MKLKWSVFVRDDSEEVVNYIELDNLGAAVVADDRIGAEVTSPTTEVPQHVPAGLRVAAASEAVEGRKPDDIAIRGIE